MEDTKNQCPNGHTLEQRTCTGHLFGVYSPHSKQCHHCGDWLKGGMTRHSCKGCGYHLCHLCWKRKASHVAKLTEDRATPSCCPGGHPLTAFVAPRGDYTCDACKATQPIGTQLLCCRKCNYDLCPSCASGGKASGGRRAISSGSTAIPVTAGWFSEPAPATPTPPGGGGGGATPPAYHRRGSGRLASAPAAMGPDGRPECRFGAACYNMETEHRQQFYHPDNSGALPTELRRRRACKYGQSCYQKNATHNARFAHPGDRCYRIGLVLFDDDQAPEFNSLWQLFQFFDPDESGHLSKEEFGEALRACKELSGDTSGLSLEDSWKAADRELHGHVNFRQFTAWAEGFGVTLPLGLEKSGASRPCRFVVMSRDGERCSCPAFEAAPGGMGLCVCGHKLSMHRSDFALRSLTRTLEETDVMHWAPGRDGLVQVHDPTLLRKLQELLTRSHQTVDNWTRDRGCSLHGVNGCPWACASKNRVPVPSGYTLVTAYRNQNMDLWQKYQLVRTAIAEECAREHVGYKPADTATSGTELDSHLDPACNEWRLFHGSSFEALLGICSMNFRLNLAGTGATWKDAGRDKGTPLYGFGIYLAEKITKADEYAKMIDKGEHEGLHCVLVSRVIGGHTNVVTTNEIEVKALRDAVFDGPYHSVFGDRVKSLGKPYREIVVYDKDQTYPEFMLIYARAYR